MKMLITCLLTFITLHSVAQKYQTIWFKGIEVSDSLHVNEISSDTAIQKICLTASGGQRHKTYFLISERIGRDTWAQPYIAFALNSPAGHGRLSADGNRIFFIKAVDDYRGKEIVKHTPGVGSPVSMSIYVSDYVGGRTWSLPHMMDDYFVFDAPPISLSISPDEKGLIFSTHLVTKRGKELLDHYSCVKNAQNKWVESEHLEIKNVVLVKKVGNTTNLGDIIHQSRTSLLINAMDGSYLASYDDKVVGTPKKIDYFAGEISWINPSGSAALTFVPRPFKIGQVQLREVKVTVPAPASVDNLRKDLASSDQTSSRVVMPTGSYYALLIGVSEYDQSDLNLERPVQDVGQIKQLLTSQYLFDESNVQSLINPTRQQIINLLFKMRSKIGPNDNLLIFYAGHGYFDKSINQGYWWPRDAAPDDPSNWLSNSDLREQIRGIKSAHTLLISDACFSGGIFRSRGLEEIKSASQEIVLLYRTPSRRAITSGNLSSVPDHSVFFQYLLKRLNENAEKYLPSQQLFAQIKPAVMNNTLTVPLDRVIMDTGDEGGDFIFIRK